MFDQLGSKVRLVQEPLVGRKVGLQLRINRLEVETALVQVLGGLVNVLAL